MATEKQSVEGIVDTIKPREEKVEDTSCDLLPIGSTLLNCAMSDDPMGGVSAGKIVNIIGDSSVGKTMVVETMFAEMANNPKFDDYELYLDDSEHALEMDLEYLFGKKAASRIKAPRYDDDGQPINSDTIEQFYANVMSLIKRGNPFVYGLDSLDTLTSVADYEQADALVKDAEKAWAKGGDGSLEMQGSYNMAKQKLLSQVLRTIKAGLAKTGSALIVISQTRDNVNARPGQATKRRAGGRALDFYCTHIVWLTAMKAIKGGKKEAEEIIGREVKAEVKKNKLTGKIREAKFDIFYDYGIDDIGSCIDFLVGQGVFKKSGPYIDASVLFEDTDKMYRKDLISLIEQENKVKELRALVGKAWKEKESLLRLDRARRFA